MADDKKYNNDDTNKYDYSSVFEFNDSESEASYVNNMNRDYLHGIYGEDIPSLTKDIRYTRTKYLRELMVAEEKQKTDHKQNLKYFLKSAPILIVSFILGLFCLCAVILLYNVSSYGSYLTNYTTHYYDYFSASPADVHRACYLLSCIFGFLSSLFFVAFSILFFFFGVGVYKRKKAIDKTYRRTVDRIETKKKENMLNGTYDPLK